MMKMPAVIALVAAITTVANARAFFTVEGGYNVIWPGDVVTIQLKADEVMCGGFGIGILSDNGADGDISNLIIAPGLTSPPPFTIIEPGEILNTESTSGGSGALLYGLSAYANANIPAGTVILSFDYTVAFPGKWVIAIAPLAAGSPYVYSDGAVYTDGAASYCNLLVGGVPTDVPIDGVTLYMIPEPMTISLVGLGGLFLRRRFG